MHKLATKIEINNKFYHFVPLEVFSTFLQDTAPRFTVKALFVYRQIDPENFHGNL